MFGSKLTRRSFFKSSLGSFFAANAVLTSDPGALAKRSSELKVALVGRAPALGRELVSFGLPLPPGFLFNSERVRLVDEAGLEITAAARALEPWRIGGREGSIRSVSATLLKVTG